MTHLGVWLGWLGVLVGAVVLVGVTVLVIHGDLEE